MSEKLDSLVARLKADPGDEAAKGELYTLVSAGLLDRLGRKIPAGVRSRVDAEDVLNEAFLRALQGIGTFQPRPGDSFIGWVYRIGKNLIIDHQRRWSAGAVHFVTGEDKGGPHASQLPPRRQRTAESQLQRQDLVDAMLGDLSEQEADVVRSRSLRGESFEEIAARWKKTPGAVQRFFARAMDRLADIARRRQGS